MNRTQSKVFCPYCASNQVEDFLRGGGKRRLCKNCSGVWKVGGKKSSGSGGRSLSKRRNARGIAFLHPERVVAVFTHGLEQVLENYRGHWRIDTFLDKGLECVECGLRADKLVLWYDWNHSFDDEKPLNLGMHKDLVAGDVLMTVDHIRPKSKGGTNHPDNLQPMCAPCNTEKGAKYSN